MEVWKKIKGFETYEISSNGRLKKNLAFRKYRSYQSKILNPCFDKDGYLRTALSFNGVTKMKRIHRLVAEAFLENKNNYPVINHKNGIKSDNFLDNLEWCTVKENNVHAIKLGLKKPLKGINHNMVKLTLIQVLEIRKNKNNLTQKKLSEIYKVSTSQIGRIIRNERWINS